MEPSSAELLVPNDSSSSASGLSNASQTEIRVEYIKHSWNVRNFSHCYQEYLENFITLPRGDETLTWSIKIYPKGNGENNKDFVFLCLNRVVGSNAKNNKIGFRSRFRLTNSEGKDIEMRIHPNPSHSDFVSYVKRDVLFPQISPADSITVFVEIDVAVETVTVSMEDSHLGICNSERQLADDYLKLLNEDLLTDFTIRVGEKEIRVHKAILAARSPVFAAMLNHENTSEAKTGTLVIKDVEFPVVREMLNFIYSGKSSPEANEIATGLLIAADKYRLDELKTHCERCLIKSLNIDNACENLILGDIYRAERVKQRALQYIQAHPRAVSLSPGWETMITEHPYLVTECVRSFDKSTATSSASALSIPLTIGDPMPSSASLFGSSGGGSGGSGESASGGSTGGASGSASH